MGVANGHQTLRVATDLNDFLRNPIGSCLEGSTFLYFFPAAGFTGFSVWGIPSYEDTKLLNAAMDVVIGAHGGPHLSLVDTRGLQRVDPSAFATMKEYIGARRDVFGKLILKQALICSEGLAGAVVAGFFAILRPAYTFNICYDTDEALDWLEISDGAQVHELLRSGARRSEDDPFVQRVRELLLTSDQRNPVAASFARSLGVSTRSLQRRLNESGTSFMREVQLSRVRRAQEMILGGGRNLSSVAFEVGCASLQHLSSLFRKVTGKTPSEWRREQESSS